MKINVRREINVRRYEILSLGGERGCCEGVRTIWKRDVDGSKNRGHDGGDEVGVRNSECEVRSVERSDEWRPGGVVIERRIKNARFFGHL